MDKIYDYGCLACIIILCLACMVFIITSCTWGGMWTIVGLIMLFVVLMAAADVLRDEIKDKQL